MINTEIAKENAFDQLIDKCNENRHCLELVRFFGAHPGTRFNRLAVIRAQNGTEGEFEIEMALVHLINEGIVKVWIENDARFYSLTKDETRRKWVLELARLERSRWQLALKKAAFRWNEVIGVRMTSSPHN